MNLRKKREAAAETTHPAADRRAVAYAAALAKLTPLLEQAGERVGPTAKDVRNLSAEYAQKAMETVQPHLAEALEKLQPHLEDALRRVQPAFDDARERLEHELLPKLVEALQEAAENPAAKEAQKRSAATLAALRGQLSLPEPEAPKRRLGKLPTFALVGAAAAGLAVLASKLLGSKNDGWEAHQPSTAYQPSAPASSAQATTDAGDSASSDTATAETTASGGEAPADLAGADLSEAVADDSAAAEGVETDVTVFTTETATAEPRVYGEGAYVGDLPPEGFTIKGNERSMKYHTSDSGGYERTIADVWFSSEEAAEAAGFTRAQR